MGTFDVWIVSGVGKEGGEVYDVRFEMHLHTMLTLWGWEVSRGRCEGLAQVQ